MFQIFLVQFFSCELYTELILSNYNNDLLGQMRELIAQYLGM